MAGENFGEFGEFEATAKVMPIKILHLRKLYKFDYDAGYCKHTHHFAVHVMIGTDNQTSLQFGKFFFHQCSFTPQLANVSPHHHFALCSVVLVLCVRKFSLYAEDSVKQNGIAGL